MLGRSAASKIAYVRLVGGPENTSNIGENPNINNLARPPRPSPNRPADFLSRTYLWHIFGSELLECHEWPAPARGPPPEALRDQRPWVALTAVPRRLPSVLLV